MVLAFVVLVLFVIIIFYNTRISEYFTMQRVKSSIDNNEYSVVKSYNDKSQAADLIANINIFTINLIKTLKSKYLAPYKSTNLMTLHEYTKGREITIVLLNRYRSESLQENEPDAPDKTSYTTNKGEVIGLCLREKTTGTNQFHDISVLKFVLLHELGHIVTPEINHSFLFWDNFKFLLDFCNKYDLYTSLMYNDTTNKVNYCGLDISYNPVADVTLSTFF